MKPRDCNADCAEEHLISQRKYFLCSYIRLWDHSHIYIYIYMFVFKMDYKFMA